jgi:aminoglycoside phosphotransferase family enzyme
MGKPLLVEAMQKREFYPHEPSEIKMVQTHISWVFITDELVYKVKKPVNYGFLDFSTLEKRRFYCEEEVRLNSRLSKEIYLGVVPILFEDDQWRLGETSEIDKADEYAVLMKRIPDNRLLNNLIVEGTVPKGSMIRVARVMAEFHARAERSAEIASFGRPDTFKVNTDENFAQTEEFIGVSISKEAFVFIKEKTEAFYLSKGHLMEKRADEGKVVDCHGDLHSQHICLWDHKVIIFDCIEFNQRFRYGDVASEIAFLAMDLEFLMQKPLATEFIEHYIELSGDNEIEEVLPFYLCYRAYVRGKVESFRINDQSTPFDERMNSLLRAQRYFFLAERYAREL